MGLSKIVNLLYHAKVVICSRRFGLQCRVKVKSLLEHGILCLIESLVYNKLSLLNRSQRTNSGDLDLILRYVHGRCVMKRVHNYFATFQKRLKSRSFKWPSFEHQSIILGYS